MGSTSITQVETEEPLSVTIIEDCELTEPMGCEQDPFFDPTKLRLNLIKLCRNDGGDIDNLCFVQTVLGSVTWLNTNAVADDLSPAQCVGEILAGEIFEVLFVLELSRTLGPGFIPPEFEPVAGN